LTFLGANVQDDWRLRPNLTLNLGLRYELTTVMTETHGKLINLVNMTDASAHLGEPLYQNPTRRNFEPRVGLAWDPFRDGKTAVRGGVG
jgi:outer membrane receptor protein involved in Fe transport